ncbi:MAG: DUF1684 domain-containing protein [Fimbriimonadaceae bacterium]
MLFYAPLIQTSTYTTELSAWRKEQEQRLMAEEGWLSVAGLDWLKEGQNSLGSQLDADVKLPSYAVSGSAGTLTLAGSEVSLDTFQDSGVTVNGSTGTHFILKSDAQGSPDRVKVGSVTFKIIVRGKRTGVRLYDSRCEGRIQFKGRTWFKPNQGYNLKAKFVPYKPERTVPILNVLGDTENVKMPGYVEFSIRGKKYRLDAQDEGDTLFFNFRDLTSGKQTYGAGRFLNVPKPVNGTVQLDFNKAVNPPCAFTSFATCPLPPAQNHLKVAIPAGELTHHPIGH